MKIIETLGATSRIWQVFIADSSSTTGAGLTGLLFNTASLTAYYHRDTDTTATAITLVTMTVGTFTSSGFKEIDATNMPGWYQLCPPNAALASGAKSVALLLKGATNMAPLPIEVQLSGFDLTTATQSVSVAQWNGTNVSSPATAGIPDVNIKNFNNVAATSVTTVNANQGTTQPLNFTGTAGSALVKSDMVDVAGAAVSTSTAQIGVNVVNFGGSAGTFASGIPSANVASGGITDASFAADASPKAIATGTAQAGAATTITLAAGANANNNFYNNTLIKLTGGTGVGQSRFISGYVGATKVATVATWVTNPDATTTYDILPFDAVAGASAPTAAQVATAVWQDTTAGDFTTAGSIGKSLFTSGNAPGAASGLALVGSNMGSASSVTGAVGSVTGNVGGNVTGSVGSVVGAVGSVTGNVGGNVVGTVASVVGNVGGNVVGSVASVSGNVGGNVVGSVGSVTAGVSLAANSVDSTAVATSGAQEIATAVGALSLGASNNNFTLIQGQTVLLSAVAGKVSGEDVGAPAFRDLADTKDVVTGTDTGTGNRTSITYNP